MKQRIDFLVKVTISFFFFLAFSFSIIAQQKVKNRIILWDVTASMTGSINSNSPNYGYNVNTDIDKVVRVGLVKIITQFPEDNGDFRVLPFRTDILDFDKVFKNDKAGKDAAINYINKYEIDKKPVGFTNICGAWDQAMTYLDINKDNIIYLFTDGNQNIAYGPNGKNCLPSIVDKYCKLTKGGETYTYFVSLNINNNLSPDPSCPIKIINVGEVRERGIPDIAKSINLTPVNSPLIINLQDKSSQVERFKVKGDGVIPENLKVSADIKIDPAYPLGIKAKIISISGNNVDIEFSLDDYTGSTIQKLKNMSSLNLQATIKPISSDSNIKFDPVDLPVVIKFKKPEKLNIKIN